MKMNHRDPLHEGSSTFSGGMNRRTIRTRHDVEDLRREGTAPAALTEHIAGFFRQLEEELTDDEKDTLRLVQHGPIVLLEAGDDLRSLNFAGLSSESGEFLRRAVEFVEKLDFGEV